MKWKQYLLITFFQIQCIFHMDSMSQYVEKWHWNNVDSTSGLYIFWHSYGVCIACCINRAIQEKPWASTNDECLVSVFRCKGLLNYLTTYLCIHGNVSLLWWVHRATTHFTVEQSPNITGLLLTNQCVQLQASSVHSPFVRTLDENMKRTWGLYDRMFTS